MILICLKDFFIRNSQKLLNLSLEGSELDNSDEKAVSGCVYSPFDAFCDPPCFQTPRCEF